MKELQELLGKIGFSDELIDAIKSTPKMESQEIHVDNICYQTFENDIISSTEINISRDYNIYNFIEDKTK